jgi:hypothetical protein
MPNRYFDAAGSRVLPYMFDPLRGDRDNGGKSRDEKIYTREASAGGRGLRSRGAEGERLL